jgi:hypothetical protein
MKPKFQQLVPDAFFTGHGFGKISVNLIARTCEDMLPVA